LKKTLALVLAFALVFSTMTVAFADDAAAISADAKICADLGMLVGDGNGVTAAYTATAPTRIQAAVMVLRLKGLEAEAKAFTGTDNFADANKAAWAAPIMAYLKAHPELGWAGDGTNFDPAGAITAQAYYKVMLETLGYKQNTATVVGDFTWEKVVEFAATKGLVKAAAATNFTVADLAVATVETLKANMKEGGKTLVANLVAAGKVDAAKATAAGIYTAAPVAPAVAVDEAQAVGNASVDVTFVDDVDASAANVANYKIEGLEIKSAALANTDRVRLETAAMTAGKLYTLTVGAKSVKFTAIAKVSGAPEISVTKSEDIEQVRIEFTKNIDQATGSNVANYSIAGVEIAKAVVDTDTHANRVTLTTVGLKNKTKYTVKVTNIKSVDGVNKKTDTDSFTSKFDTTPPKIAAVDGVVVETNQRIQVNFSEEVTKASAENLANYSIKVDEKDGDALEIVSVKWDSDDENNVLITTEAMDNHEDYVVSVNGIVDQRKAANTMTRPSTGDFKGIAEDEKAPTVVGTPVAKSSTKVLVTFGDSSRIDEATATNLANYDLEDLNVEEVSTVEDSLGTFRVLLTVEEMETGKHYDLTIDGIADEFGNTMDKEVTKSVSASQGSMASVAVKDSLAYAIDEKKVVVIFTDEVDETSAENIANYSIDGDIGAPTKAEYEADGYPANSVLLTTNDIVNGFENDTRHGDGYTLTVDGVMDLAGNDLFYEVDLDTIPTDNPNTAAYPKVRATKWDSDTPDIDDASAVDKNVVALTFDEEVKFGATTQLQLIAGHDVLTLDATGYSEDDTVVEFTYADTQGLADGVAYSVYHLIGNPIEDLIGNDADAITAADSEEYTFDGTDSDHDRLELDSYYQKDATQFEATMTGEVQFINGDGAGSVVDFVYKTDDPATLLVDESLILDHAVITTDLGKFDVKIKSTDNTKVRFWLEDDAATPTTLEILNEDTEYDFNFALFLADKSGFAVANDDEEEATTVLTGEYTDEDAPYINEVVAIDRNTIQITFNERIDESAIDWSGFDLRNYDLDENVTFTHGSSENGDDDGIIEITVNKAMEARYEYQLSIDTGAAVDFATNPNDDDTFYFDGSNLQH